MDFLNFYEFLRTFPKYAWYEKVALVATVPLVVYALYLYFAARPSLIDYRLDVSPGHFLTSTGELAADGNIQVGLMLENLSTGGAELHNVDGEFWTDGTFIAAATRQPNRRIDRFVYYDFTEPLLHKSTGGSLFTWSFRPPHGQQKIPIGYRAVSSETEWQAGQWFVVSRKGHWMIVDEKQLLPGE